MRRGDCDGGEGEMKTMVAGKKLVWEQEVRNQAVYSPKKQLRVRDRHTRKLGCGSELVMGTQTSMAVIKVRAD